MVPGRVAETAEHRPGCQHSQHRGRTKSQSRFRIGRKGERQGNGAKDGNRPRAHDRSPACCRFSFNCRVLEKVPAATPEIGIAEKTTLGIPDAGRCLGMRRNAMICDIGAGTATIQVDCQMATRRRSPKGTSPSLCLAPSARNPLATTVSESEPNDQSDCNLQHWESCQLCGLHSTPRELRGGTDPPLRQTIKSQLTYVNLTDASFKRTFRNLRKLDWCEGRLLGTVKKRPPIL